MRGRLLVVLGLLVIAGASAVLWALREDGVETGRGATAAPLGASEPAATTSAPLSRSPAPSAPPTVPSDALAAGGAAGGASVVPSLPSYQLTRVSEGLVAVNLAGGAATTTAPSEPRPAPPQTRTIRGRVVDAQGNAAPSAVVLAGERVDFLKGQLSSETGATTAVDGSFALVEASTREVSVVALHRLGWSRVTRVQAGRGDVTLELRLAPDAALDAP